MSGGASTDEDDLERRWLHGVIRRTPVVSHGVTEGLSGATSHAPPTLVIKIGGSLLARPGWPTLIASLVGARAERPCCLVVGGGAVVDGLRAIDRVEPQAPTLMHDLSIDAMRLTARLVAAAIGLPVEASPPDTRGVAVLDVPAWLTEHARAASLPVGWQVTSDAIAARVTVVHGGGLLLAKSVPPPPCPAGDEVLSVLARDGWVDEHFPVAAGPLAEITWAAPTEERPSD